MYHRYAYEILASRLHDQRQFIQVLTGPRQVGKTTLVHELNKNLHIPFMYASADETTFKTSQWIEQQWDLAQLEMRAKKLNTMVLIFDEIQKIPDWSERIKHLWDKDTRLQQNIKVLLLGSAPLLIQQGLKESLAGRFEVIPMTHWSWDEMHQAFGITLEEYIYFGGYPGAVELIADYPRWRRYINESLIETTLSKDILLLNPVHKPALLRRLFELACHYSGQILAYQKMLGQLVDAGNTTTLAHYLTLLKNTGMVSGIEKFSIQKVRQRASSPKLQVFNNALISAQNALSFEDAKRDRAYWGRLVESAVGSYLLNQARLENFEVYYWREQGKEVDFVLQQGEKIVAIEVKSQAIKESLPGLDSFIKQFNPLRNLVVGGSNLTLEKFLQTPVIHWFS